MKYIIPAMVVLLTLAACGKFDDPNVKDQYYVYLEDEETKQPVSDQVLFTMYRNGTATCGFAVLNEIDDCPEGVSKAAQQCHEDACYRMVEEVFQLQLQSLQEAIQAETTAAVNPPMNSSNSTLS